MQTKEIRTYFIANSHQKKNAAKRICTAVPRGTDMNNTNTQRSKDLTVLTALTCPLDNIHLPEII